MMNIKKIVKVMFDKVVNRYLITCNEKFIFDVNDITEVHHGRYQGITIFLIHKDSYDAVLSDFIYTSNYCGASSNNDTLLGISKYREMII